METDTLNTLVTSAIWRAEQLEERRIPSAGTAWAEVSFLEEELARVLPVSDAEGRIAHRGSVRAALKAGDYFRARVLVESYLAEESAPRSLKEELRGMLRDAAKQRSALEEKESDRSSREAPLESVANQMIAHGFLLSEAVSEFEKRFIKQALEMCNGSHSKTAAALGIHPNTLSRKVEELGLLRRPRRVHSGRDIHPDKSPICADAKK